MTGKREHDTARTEKPAITLPGTVEKIIPPSNPAEAEKAQIAVEGADHLYREIRVDNELQDENGKTVSLKPGAHVEVTIEAEEKQHVVRSRATKRGFSESTSSDK
jgi:hypothetical protein